MRKEGRLGRGDLGKHFGPAVGAKHRRRVIATLHAANILQVDGERT